MTDLAALDIVIGANIDKAIANVAALSKVFDGFSIASNKTSASLDQTTRNLAKTTSATAAAAGGMKLIGDGSIKAADSVSKVPTAVEALSDSFTKFTGEFEAKWNPIIADAERLATPLDVAAAKVKTLQTQVSGFGGGIFNFQATGVDKLEAATRLIVDEINGIPTQNVINFTLSSNTQAVLSELGALSTEINDLGNGGSVSIQKINTALAQLHNASANATNPTQLLQYDKAINLLKNDLGNITDSAKKAGVSLANIGAGSNAGTIAITNLGRVFQDLPFGFIGISNNLNPLLESFERLGATAKATGVSVSSILTKSLIGGGGLGLALSLVTSALTFASFGMGAWTRGFGKSKEAVDDATQSNEDYAKSLKDISDNQIKNAEKEITSFQVLINKAKDATVAVNERMDAAGKLQEQSSGYFATLTKEQILYDNITDAVNKTTDALINNALAQAAQEKAQEAGKRYYDLLLQQRQAASDLATTLASLKKENAQGIAILAPTLSESGVNTQQDPLTAQLFKQQKALDDINSKVKDTKTQLDGFFKDAENFGKAGDNADKAAVIIAKLNNEIDLLNKKSIATGGNFDTDKISDYKKAVEDLLALPQTPETKKDIDELVAKIKELGGSFDDAAGHAKKAKETIADVLAEMNKELNTLDAIHINLGTDETEAEVNTILETIKKLTKEFNVDPNDTIIKKLFGDIAVIELPRTLKEFGDFVKKNFPDQDITLPVTPTIDDKSFGPDFDKRIQEFASTMSFAEKFKITIPLGFESSSKIDGDLAKFVNQVVDETKQIATFYDLKIPFHLNFIQANDFARQAANILDDMKSQLTDMFSGALSSIGESLGSGENLFAGFRKVLGSAVKALGEDLIKLGTLAEATKLAVADIFKNPLLEIAIGIALTALGSKIEHGGVKLAAGGIVPPGYPNDTYPAFLTSQEAVIPLDKGLDKYLPTDTQTQVFIPNVTLRGSDLVLAFDRQQTKNKRTY
jgi:hypothetical protein